MRRPLWQYLRQAFAPVPASYAASRIALGFAGLEIDRLKSELDDRLPESEPVALSPALNADAFAAQRIWEGIYPRRVVLAARFMLDLAPGPAESLATYPGHGFIRLVENTPVSSAAPGKAGPDTDLHKAQPLRRSIARFLLSIAALLGWGWLAWKAIYRVVPNWMPSDIGFGLRTGAAGTFGAGCISVLVTVATWTRVPLNKNLLAVLGLLAFSILAGLWCYRRGFRQLVQGARAFRAIRFPEWLAAGAGLWCFVRMLGRFPISGWDGRSIWFFRAHQVEQEGLFSVADASNVAYLVTHPSYPLLFPAWLSQFTAFGPFDERQASLGIAALLFVLIVTLGGLLVRQCGRGTAIAFSAAFFLAAMQPLHDGYPDMIVTVFLMIAVLAFAHTETTGLALIAILGASLTKREGMVIGSAVLLLMVAFAPQFEASSWRKRMFAFSALLPALGHAVWYRLLGLPEIYAAARIPGRTILLERLDEIFNRFVDLAPGMPIIYVSLACLLLVVTTPSAGISRLTVLGTMAAFGFTALVFVTTPLPFASHVSLALPRVVMHGVWLGIAAGLLHFPNTRKDFSRP